MGEKRYCIQSPCSLHTVGTPKRLGARAAAALQRSGGQLEPLPGFQATPYALAAGELVWLGDTLASEHPRMILFGDIRVNDVSDRPPYDLKFDPITQALNQRRTLLQRAVRSGKLSDIESASFAVIGLGHGLTPSGDDLVGALLFGLRARKVELGGLSERTVAHAVNQTNTISATLLADLARGESFDVMHDLARAYQQDLAPDKSAPLKLTLLSIGHHSGTDLLAGLHMAMFDYPRHA